MRTCAPRRRGGERRQRLLVALRGRAACRAAQVDEAWPTAFASSGRSPSSRRAGRPGAQDASASSTGEVAEEIAPSIAQDADSERGSPAPAATEEPADPTPRRSGLAAKDRALLEEGQGGAACTSTGARLGWTRRARAALSAGSRKGRPRNKGRPGARDPGGSQRRVSPFVETTRCSRSSMRLRSSGTKFASAGIDPARPIGNGRWPRGHARGAPRARYLRRSAPSETNE